MKRAVFLYVALMFLFAGATYGQSNQTIKEKLTSTKWLRLNIYNDKVRYMYFTDNKVIDSLPGTKNVLSVKEYYLLSDSLIHSKIETKQDFDKYKKYQDDNGLFIVEFYVAKGSFGEMNDIIDNGKKIVLDDKKLSFMLIFTDGSKPLYSSVRHYTEKEFNIIKDELLQKAKTFRGTERYKETYFDNLARNTGADMKKPEGDLSKYEKQPKKKERKRKEKKR